MLPRDAHDFLRQSFTSIMTTSACISTTHSLDACQLQSDFSNAFGPLGRGPVLDLVHLTRLVLLGRAGRCQIYLLALDVALLYSSCAACLAAIQSNFASGVYYLRSYHSDSVTAVTLQKHPARLFMPQTVSAASADLTYIIAGRCD